MIIGAHSIIYSKNAEADRAFLRDVMRFPNVDAGDGWLIFGLPPAEGAVHPSSKNDLHEFYLICDDVNALVGEMKRRHVACTPVKDLGWGVLTHVTLPGGGKLGVYQPRHERPESMAPGGAPARASRAPEAATKKPAKRATKRSAGKSSSRSPAKKKATKKKKSASR